MFQYITTNFGLLYTWFDGLTNRLENIKLCHIENTKEGNLNKYQMKKISFIQCVSKVARTIHNSVSSTFKMIIFGVVDSAFKKYFFLFLSISCIYSLRCLNSKQNLPAGLYLLPNT